MLEFSLIQQWKRLLGKEFWVYDGDYGGDLGAVWILTVRKFYFKFYFLPFWWCIAKGYGLNYRCLSKNERPLLHIANDKWGNYMVEKFKDKIDFIVK